MASQPLTLESFIAERPTATPPQAPELNLDSFLAQRAANPDTGPSASIPHPEEVDRQTTVNTRNVVQTLMQPQPAISPGPAGLLQPGNIDLSNRPRVRNSDGSISAVRSMSFGLPGGREVLVPTVSDDGRIMPNAEAIRSYYKTGKHLGIFDGPANATAYAQQLHQQQAASLGPQLVTPEQAAAENPPPPAMVTPYYRQPGTSVYRGPNGASVNVEGANPTQQPESFGSLAKRVVMTPIVKPEDIDSAFPFLVGPFRIHAGILKSAAGMTSPGMVAVSAGSAGLGGINRDVSVAAAVNEQCSGVATSPMALAATDASEQNSHNLNCGMRFG